MMEFFKRLFRKKKAVYESRTYVGTPGGFLNRRSPSDILVTSHPSPAEYQEQLDSVAYISRREQAITFFTEECESEDLFEDQSDHANNNSDSATVYSSSSDEEEDVVQRRYAPAVNRQTAQEQWSRLQGASPYAKQTKQAQPAPVYSPVYSQRQAPTPRQAPVAQHQQDYYRQAPVYCKAPQRVSFLPQRSQIKQTRPIYQAPVPPQRVSCLPQRSQQTQPCKITSAATMAARYACEDKNDRSYHERESDRIRAKAGLSAFPYRMVGGIPILTDPIIHNHHRTSRRPAKTVRHVPGSWVN